MLRDENLNLKSLFVITLILSMLIFPCVSGNLDFLEKGQVTSDKNTLNGEERTWLKFCYGEISGLFEIKSGYSSPYAYGFNAVDVICITCDTGKPFYYQHLTGGVDCAMGLLPTSFFNRLRGTVSDDFIYASYGFLSPKIFLLIYNIQN